MLGIADNIKNDKDKGDIQMIQIRKTIEIVKKTRSLFMNTDAARRYHRKGAADYVTEIDTAVQDFLNQELYAQYPQVQFMGEERDNTSIDFSKPLWILDPADGTTNLIHGYQHCVVSLAYYEEGEIKVGIIYHPYTNDVFYAVKGKGAMLNDEKIHVSHIETLEESLISIGTSPYYKEWAKYNFPIFEKVFTECQDIRRSGSAALDLAYVACGRLDGFFEKHLNPWDYAAGLLLVAEAGGHVIAYQGGEVSIEHPSDIIAGNGYIEKKLKDLLG